MINRIFDITLRWAGHKPVLSLRNFARSLSSLFVTYQFARISSALFFAAVTLTSSFSANATITQIQNIKLPGVQGVFTTSATFPLASSPALGDTVVLYIWQWGGSAVVAPTLPLSASDNCGNVYTSVEQTSSPAGQGGAPGYQDAAILSTIVTSNPSTTVACAAGFKITATSARTGQPYGASVDPELGAVAVEYSGLSGVDKFALQPVGTGSPASMSLGSTTSNANELVAALVSILEPAVNFAPTITPSPVAWTQQGVDTDNANFAAGEMASEILNATANPSITWTPGSSSFANWVSVMVAFKGDLGCTSKAPGGDWSLASTWTNCNNSVPPVGGTATIAIGAPVVISTSTNAITKLTINTGASLTATGGTLNFGDAQDTAAIFNSGTLNLGGAGTVVLNNGLSLVGTGTWTFNNISAGANTFYAANLASTSTINVTGNLSSSGIFTSGNATWAFTGTGAQTVTGALTFANLKINNTGSGVTLASNVTVSTGLTLTKGLINTGSNSLIYSPNCVTTPITVSSGSYINGNLSLNVPSTNPATCTFSVGDSTNYAPISITKTGTNSGTLTGSTIAVPNLATLTGTPAPTTFISVVDSVNRTWTLTPGGLANGTTYTATFNYCNAVGTGCGVDDVALGASYNYFIALEEVGTTWSQKTVGTLNPATTQVTGLNAFGTFAVGQPAAKVNSINCAIACTTPIFAKTVSWTVTFSGNVTNVNAADFSLVPSAGLPGTSIASVSPVKTSLTNTWTVTANVGTGSGTLGLNLNATGGTDISPQLMSAPYPPVIFTGQVYTNVSGPPLALYHMDESGWGSSGTPVTDSSGNGNNGKAINGATTASASPLPAISANPGTCSYGEMTYSTVSNGYVQTPLPHLTSNFTVAAWIYPTNVNYVGSRVFVDDTGSSGYGFSIDNGSGNLRLYDRGISPVILDSTYTLANNTWYFVAAVADISNKTRYIYVFNSAGTLLNVTKDATPFTGTWTTDNGTVNIGSSESYYFQGNLDEVQIYQEALTQNALVSLATQTHACSVASLDHILIQSSGSGLTCAANTLTLVACQSADCSVTYSGGVSGTLSNTGSVNWDGTTGGAAGAGFIITTGSTSVTKNMQTTSAGTVTFGLAASNPGAPNGATCNFGSPSCTFTTNTAGFIFSDTSSPGNVYTLPVQNSGIASPTIYLRAVQSSATNAAVCTPAIINQTVSPLLGYVCNNPAACQAGNLVTITNATTSAATSIASGSPGTTSVSLNFDANGSAPITVRYDDVGLITLNANMTAKPFSTATTVNLNGSSNAYVVKPNHFVISGTPSGSTIPAGSNFSATVTAYNGLPTPTVTANFGLETPAEGVTLSSNLVSPIGGNNPTLGNNAIAGSRFSSGYATVNNLTWGEVGNITLTAVLTNASGYLGSGASATPTGTSATVGRFIPDHFDTAVIQTGTSPALVPMNCPPGLGISCPGTFNGLVYSGQPFSLQVTAMNSSEVTTRNYDSTLGFSKVVTLSPYSSLGGATLLANGSLGVTSEATFASGTHTDATESYSFSTVPTIPTNIYIRAKDTDNVTSLRASSIEGGVAVASGRFKVPNVYGSELLPLSMSATAQFYNASNNWVTSTTDNVTSLTLPASYSIGTGSTNVTKTPATGVVFGGVLTINLSAPLQPGSALVAPTVNPASLLLTPTLGGTATFGIYRGNNSLIYMRENY